MHSTPSARTRLAACAVALLALVARSAAPVAAAEPPELGRHS